MSQPDIADVLNGTARWTIVCGDVAELAWIIPGASVDVSISDPPYSAGVHRSVRSAKRNTAPDVSEFACRTRRTVDLGFAHLTPTLRRSLAAHSARTVKRWSLFFSDVESCWLWRLSCEAAGLEYIRTLEWRRIGGAPQFTGDRPASAFETITAVHPKGRKRWNGGGKAGQYTANVVQNRLGERGSRVHPTQKPIELMMGLVEDFTDFGDVVVDWTAGSGTTGCACVLLGRRFIGFELDPEHAETACDRMRALESGSTLQALRARQGALFGVDR